MKEASLKSYILYDSNSIMFLKRQNYGESKKISGHQSRRGERRISRAQGILRGVKTLRTILQEWPCVSIHLPKSPQCTLPALNPQVNYGPWVMTTCHCSFVLGLKKIVPHRWVMLKVGRRCMGGARGRAGSLLTFSLLGIDLQINLNTYKSPLSN